MDPTELTEKSNGVRSTPKVQYVDVEQRTVSHLRERDDGLTAPLNNARGIPSSMLRVSRKAIFARKIIENYTGSVGNNWCSAEAGRQGWDIQASSTHRWRRNRRTQPKIAETIVVYISLRQFHNLWQASSCGGLNLATFFDFFSNFQRISTTLIIRISISIQRWRISSLEVSFVNCLLMIFILLHHIV